MKICRNGGGCSRKYLYVCVESNLSNISLYKNIDEDCNHKNTQELIT